QEIKNKRSTIDSIQFNYKIIDLKENSFKITASLINDRNDTVRFLSHSCSGDYIYLKYDTASFLISHEISCNASWPVIIKIAPKSKYVFSAELVCLKINKKPELSFYFNQVSSTFNIATYKNSNEDYISNHKPENLIIGKEIY
ncbi:MAG: hypothetical protein H7321_00180, partial [Bacteroidia bacterium]|nr:hypothetical protein [Bacteroidia bacterium]